MSHMDESAGVDETDVTEEEFDRMFDAGQPVELVGLRSLPSSREWTGRLSIEGGRFLAQGVSVAQGVELSA